eukprot:c15590_g1_i1.p1 GENE.c15590_g1_i1~~c15590_g1_i1.p1  ORF type:complete len:472 (+),score=143.33 c15590_g1_i1:9-1424(+)
MSQTSKSGHLWRKSGVFLSKWKRKWFLIEEGTLYESKEIPEGSAEPVPATIKGQIGYSVRDVQVEILTSNRHYSFIVRGCIHNRSLKSEKFLLAAESENEMLEWTYFFSHGRTMKVVATRTIAPAQKVTLVRNLSSRKTSSILHYYDVCETLGIGGFSVVRKGNHKSENRSYALKMIDTEVYEANKEYIDQESKLLASLNHPNIVKFKELYRTPVNFVLVMEYLEGDQLFEALLSRSNYLEFDSMEIAATILDAVRYLHANNIVHRDIKPQNMIFDSKGPDAILKLTDFGLATVFENTRSVKADCGTTAFMAPEMLQHKSYGPAIDMWSCGVVIYTLICGRAPFEADTVPELIQKICKGKVEFFSPFWDSVTSEAKDLISHLLEVDPEKRYTAQQALEHVWFRSVVKDGSRRDLSPALLELRREKTKSLRDKSAIFTSESEDLKEVKQNRKSVIGQTGGVSKLRAFTDLLT